MIQRRTSWVPFGQIATFENAEWEDELDRMATLGTGETNYKIATQHNATPRYYTARETAEFHRLDDIEWLIGWDRRSRILIGETP